MSGIASLAREPAAEKKFIVEFLWRAPIRIVRRDRVLLQFALVS
jgi:hypothetical protein